MAEHGSWDSIKRFGLRSTTALLDLFGVQGTVRVEIESKQRPDSIRIHHPAYGSAVIRDQKPLSERALLGCLHGMSPAEWYQLLNRKVFFWLNRERLMRLLCARAYRNSSHCVLTIATEKLLVRHSDQITLSAINSGSTIYKPQPRGTDTFSTICNYPFDHWSRKRRKCDAVVELAVDYAVPEIIQMVSKVEHILENRVTEVLYENERH